MKAFCGFMVLPASAVSMVYSLVDTPWRSKVFSENPVYFRVLKMLCVHL